MAREKKTMKLRDLQCSIPESGQYASSYTGADGIELEGLPSYEYGELKTSLEEHGYDPVQFSHIAVLEGDKVCHGGHRTWLMQKDMELPGDTDIEVEVYTRVEFYKECADKILDKDALPTFEDDGTITAPKQMLNDYTVPLDTSEFIRRHRGEPDIPDYPYDYVCADGTVVDAGKSD